MLDVIQAIVTARSVVTIEIALQWQSKQETEGSTVQLNHIANRLAPQHFEGVAEMMRTTLRD